MKVVIHAIFLFSISCFAMAPVVSAQGRSYSDSDIKMMPKEIRASMGSVMRKDASTSAIGHRMNKDKDMKPMMRGGIARDFGVVMARMTAHVTRLTDIQNRLESRADTIELELGYDLDNFDTIVDEASQHLIYAQGTLDSAQDAYDTLDPETGNAKEQLVQIRSLLKDAKDAIQKAHRLLLDAAHTLRALNETQS